MAFSSLSLLLFVLATAYGIPSFLLYIYVIFVLIRDRNVFHSWFYRFFMVNGILDCCDILMQTIFERIPFNGLFVSFYRNLPNLLATVFVFYKYFHLYSHFIGSFVVGINRFYVIVIPSQFHTVKFQRVMYWLSLVAILGFPLPFTVQLLYLGASYVPFDERCPDSSLVMQYNNSALPNFRNSENAVILISIFAVLSLIFNAATLLSIAHTRSQVLSVQDNKIRKAEFNLFVASLMIFSVELLMVAHQRHAIPVTEIPAPRLDANNLGQRYAYAAISFLVTRF